MSRQNKQTLNQRNQQNRYDDDRDDHDELAHDTAGEKQWQERRHRGQDGKDDRLGNLNGSVNRGLEIRIT